MEPDACDFPACCIQRPIRNKAKGKIVDLETSLDSRVYTQKYPYDKICSNSNKDRVRPFDIKNIRNPLVQGKRGFNNNMLCWFDNTPDFLSIKESIALKLITQKVAKSTAVRILFLIGQWRVPYRYGCESDDQQGIPVLIVSQTVVHLWLTI